MLLEKPVHDDIAAMLRSLYRRCGLLRLACEDGNPRRPVNRLSDWIDGVKDVLQADDKRIKANQVMKQAMKEKLEAERTRLLEIVDSAIASSHHEGEDGEIGEEKKEEEETDEGNDDNGDVDDGEQGGTESDEDNVEVSGDKNGQGEEMADEEGAGEVEKADEEEEEEEDDDLQQGPAMSLKAMVHTKHQGRKRRGGKAARKRNKGSSPSSSSLSSRDSKGNLTGRSVNTINGIDGSTVAPEGWVLLPNGLVMDRMQLEGMLRHAETYQEDTIPAERVALHCSALMVVIHGRFKQGS